MVAANKDLTREEADASSIRKEFLNEFDEFAKGAGKNNGALSPEERLEILDSAGRLSASSVEFSFKGKKIMIEHHPRRESADITRVTIDGRPVSGPIAKKIFNRYFDLAMNAIGAKGNGFEEGYDYLADDLLK